MKGNQFTRIAVGNPVDDKLQLGLDPQKFDNLSLFTIDENGNMNIDDDMKWMTDYDIAVSKGMGITMDITDDEYNNGFDRLIVLGVKSTDATTSKQLVEQLIHQPYLWSGRDEFFKSRNANQQHTGCKIRLEEH